MRDRIIQGPRFSLQERNDILEYCEDDVRNLARLLPFIMPTIASIPHALARGSFMWPIARQERRGIPLGDGQLLERLRTQWAPMQTDLVVEMDRPFGCYEHVDGVPHWRSHLFAAYLKRMGMSWLMYADGSLDERDQTFRDMEGKYPHIGPLRELRCSLSCLRPIRGQRFRPNRSSA